MEEESPWIQQSGWSVDEESHVRIRATRSKPKVTSWHQQMVVTLVRSSSLSLAPKHTLVEVLEAGGSGADLALAAPPACCSVAMAAG